MATPAPSQSPKRKTSVIFCVVGLFLIAALGAWELVVNDTFVRQQIRLEQAWAHAAKVTPLLAAEPAFSKVQCVAYTGMGGVLKVKGKIENEEVFKRLRSIISQSHPPVSVFYELESPDPNERFEEVVPPLLRGH